MADTSNSASGFDIIFTSDAAGTQKLDHEIESYNPSTGQFIAWVRIPTLSHTSNTVIYLFYGNSSIATSQENRTGVWDSNYKGVWHLPTVAPTINDSTSNGNNGTNSGTTATAGKIGGGSNNSGANLTYIGVAGNSTLYDPSQITYSAWINPFALTNQDGDAYMAILSIGGKYVVINNNGTIQADTVTSGTFRQSISTDIVLTNSWQYVTAVSASDNLWHLYLNGSETGYSSQVIGNGTVQSDSGPLYIGANTSNPYYGNLNGSLDEVRVSNTARSADWIATEYNNQNVPSTFYTLAPEGGSAVSITVNTVPPGLAITVDGQNYTAPQTFQWTPGSSHPIAVNSTTQAGTTGTRYVFANWSDAGANPHNVVASSSTPTYTATFSTQYQLTTTATAGGSISPAGGVFTLRRTTITHSRLKCASRVFASTSGSIIPRGGSRGVRTSTECRRRWCTTTFWIG